MWQIDACLFGAGRSTSRTCRICRTTQDNVSDCSSQKGKQDLREIANGDCLSADI
jgi:hypothetical protein